MRVSLLYSKFTIEGDKNTDMIANIDCFIEIQKNNAQKKVSILTPANNKETVIWDNIKDAEYVCDIDESSELWHAQFSMFLPFPTYCRPFSICYQYEDNTFWDNNSGINYWAGLQYLNLYINDKKGNVYLTESSLKNDIFSGKIGVTNIDFEKTVKIIYTPDGWKSRIEIPATYLDNPETRSLERKNGIDFFEFESPVWAPEGTHYIEYFVSYFVNETSYWDNNFGRNYKIFLS